MTCVSYANSRVYISSQARTFVHSLFLESSQVATTKELMQHDKLMSEGAEAFTKVVFHKDILFPVLGLGWEGDLSRQTCHRHPRYQTSSQARTFVHSLFLESSQVATTKELMQHDKLMSEGAEAFTKVVFHKDILFPSLPNLS